MAKRRVPMGVIRALLACALLIGAGSVVPGAATATTTSSPSSAASLQRASAPALSVSPPVYIGGEAITWTGAVGHAGKQRIRLQSRMNRPGAVWGDVDGFHGTTDASGRFRFVFPAPAMWEIVYRVKSRSGASAPLVMRPRSEEITMTAQGGNFLWPDNAAPTGRDFTVEVDTTTDAGFMHLAAPAFPGRTVTLQERRGSGWRTVTSGRTDNTGRVSLTVPGTSAGVHVYRARNEAWTKNKNRVGTFTSFPLAVRVQALPPGLLDLGVTGKPGTPSGGSGAAPGTGGVRYAWYPLRYDYAWLRGEGLESRPHLGTVATGWWSDTGNGTGRVTHFNGGLAVQSGWQRPGAGIDAGTTSATLRDAAATTGRWEFNLRTVERERGATPYRALVELVPEKSGAASCLAQSIVIADARMSRGGLSFGVASAKAKGRWTRTVPTNLANQPHTAAVEVGHDHLTWFVDGKVVGSLRQPSVLRGLRGVTLTPRLSLVGSGSQEMNASMLFSDWQRAYPLETGRQVRTGPALKKAGFKPGC